MMRVANVGRYALDALVPTPEQEAWWRRMTAVDLRPRADQLIVCVPPRSADTARYLGTWRLRDDAVFQRMEAGRPVYRVPALGAPA